MNKQEELKPCPFCGKSDIRMDFDEDLYYAVCNEVDCCAEGPYSVDRNAAIAGWNKRAVVKVLADALKGLKPYLIPLVLIVVGSVLILNAIIEVNK